MTAPATASAAEAALRRAIPAVYTAFVGAGFGFASWAARIPQVRDRLHVTPAALGVILLCLAVGSLIAIPSAGLLVGRMGEARTVCLSAVVVAAGLAVVGAGYRFGVAPVCVGLLLIGTGSGAWDVAMNVQAASVERLLGRSIMSRFHAGFSVGTVLGAGIGAALVAIGVPVTAHLVAVALIVGLVVPWSVTRGFVPHVTEPEAGGSGRRVWAAWREPRTLLIGLFVLCLTFTEGSGNDWAGIAVIDGYRTADAVGTAALAIFLAGMTVGRWFGPAILDRYGRVPVLRACSALALAGLLLVVFGHLLPVALVGTALWGLGTSLGFPTGISAASDDPTRAAARVSVTASIAYLAFLAGPPLIGFAGNHIGVLRGLTVTAAAIAISLVVSGACAPLPARRPQQSPTALQTR